MYQARLYIEDRKKYKKLSETQKESPPTFQMLTSNIKLSESSTVQVSYASQKKTISIENKLSIY